MASGLYLLRYVQISIEWFALSRAIDASNPSRYSLRCKYHSLVPARSGITNT